MENTVVYGKKKKTPPFKTFQLNTAMCPEATEMCGKVLSCIYAIEYYKADGCKIHLEGCFYLEKTLYITGLQFVK